MAVSGVSLQDFSGKGLGCKVNRGGYTSVGKGIGARLIVEDTYQSWLITFAIMFYESDRYCSSLLTGTEIALFIAVQG